MNDHPLRDLSEQYTCALQNYLKTEGEQALHQAYAAAQPFPRSMEPAAAAG